MHSSQLLEVWCEDAEGFGLPEEVEERLLRERANKQGRRGGKRGSVLQKASEALFGKPVAGRRLTVAQRVGAAISRAGGKRRNYRNDANRQSIRTQQPLRRTQDPRMQPVNPNDPFAKFKQQVSWRCRGTP